jgi:hypothetical protein
MYKEEGPEKASRGTFDADLLEYVTRAQMGPDWEAHFHRGPT